MAKSILEQELKRAIAAIEAEKRDMIKQLTNALNEKNGIIADYEIVLSKACTRWFTPQ